MHSFNRRSFLVSAAPLAAGCFIRPVYEQPSRRWQLVTSPHFRLYTDTEALSYRRALEQFETVHACMRASFFRNLTIPPVEVMMFNSTDDARDVIGDAAATFSPTVGPHGVIAARDFTSYAPALHTLTFSLAAKFAEARYPSLPLFLQSGLASYFETVRLVENEIWLGARPVGLRTMLRDRRFASLAQLVAMSPKEFRQGFESMNEAGAWLFVHYAFHDTSDGKPAQSHLGRLLVPYTRREAEKDPAAVILDAYPGLSLDELDRRLRQYGDTMSQKQGDTVYTFPAPSLPALALNVEPANLDVVRDYAKALRAHRPPLR